MFHKKTLDHNLSKVKKNTLNHNLFILGPFWPIVVFIGIVCLSNWSEYNKKLYK